MTDVQRPFALFRVAAGPRLGHGHLRRAEVLATALARPSVVSIRGAGAATPLPTLTSASAAAALAVVAPAVLVIDDPAARHGLRWCRAAERRGVPVVSLHDLGIARLPSTLAIDGSISSPAHGWRASAVLRGVDHAVIRPPRRNRRSGDVRRLLISLGGGSRRALVDAVAAELARRWPGLEILTTQSALSRSRGGSGPLTVTAPAGLVEWLARVDLAILAGGVSVYEAVAAGVPAVAVSVVPGQRETLRGFAARGLLRDAGRAYGLEAEVVARRVADCVSAAIADAAWRRHLRREGPRVVDGHGATRVAGAIVRVAEARRG